MKRALLATGLLLALSRLSGASEAFDPKEPITLELHEASLVDVIVTLGAMAGLPVVIEPGIQGKVTIRVEDVPFEEFLDSLSKRSGVSLRIVDGKLVASRSPSPSPRAAVLPEKFSGLRGIAVEEYSRSSASSLFVKARWNGSEVCRRLSVGQGASTALFPASARAQDLPLEVGQFGYDPVTGTRFIVADEPMNRAFALRPRSVVSAESLKDSRPLRMIFGADPRGEDCPDLDRREIGPRPHTLVFLELRERLEDGTLRSVSNPRVQALAGTAFAIRSGSDDAGGEGRAFVIRGYLSRDGASVAVALVAEATWTDPTDGREYIYAQVADVRERLVPLVPGGVTVATLPAGVATDRPLELSVSLGP